MRLPKIGETLYLNPTVYVNFKITTEKLRKSHHPWYRSLNISVNINNTCTRPLRSVRVQKLCAGKDKLTCSFLSLLKCLQDTKWRLLVGGVNIINYNSGTAGLTNSEIATKAVSSVRSFGKSPQRVDDTSLGKHLLLRARGSLTMGRALIK